MASASFIGVLMLFRSPFKSRQSASCRLRCPAPPGTALDRSGLCGRAAGRDATGFGCFNIGTVTGLHFSQASVYWHLRVSQQEGCGRGQEYDRTRGGGRRASVALEFGPEALPRG